MAVYILHSIERTCRLMDYGIGRGTGNNVIQILGSG